MAKPQKKKNTKPMRLEEVELHTDAWERFEKGIKAAVKVKPSLPSKPKTSDAHEVPKGKR